MNDAGVANLINQNDLLPEIRRLGLAAIQLNLVSLNEVVETAAQTDEKTLFESRPKSQPEWASKAKHFETTIERMEVDLNHQVGILRQMNKEKLETIAKWTEKFEMSERLVASKNEAEQRLREV